MEKHSNQNSGASLDIITPAIASTEAAAQVSHGSIFCNMHISLNWLNELVGVSQSPTALAEILTMAGFEVESIEDRRQWAEGVVVGQVLARAPHPNADKLSVCSVDIGDGNEPVQIVCGAANVRAGIFVPVAKIGAYLPVIDLKIKPAKLRGENSAGMICSLAEVGLAKESAGIHIFAEVGDAHAPVLGTPVGPLLGLDDVILDLSSTANRADALSMVGIAREVAALTTAVINLPTVTPVSLLAGEKNLTVSVADPKVCPVYVATLIENVRVAPAPDWLQRKLQAAGIRSINNIVDITNYVLLEWGQPLHAFDADRLGSHQIGVEFAQLPYTFKTLDDQDRPLQASNLMITAGGQPVALAGVMGGADSEVHSGTTNVVLEAAIFDSVIVRKSARAQGLRSEASTRYERGVNMAELDMANQRAINLLVEIGGGTVTAQAIVDHRPDWVGQPRTINLRLARIQKILGPIMDEAATEETGEPGEISAADVEKALTSLGCQLTVINPEPTEWAVIIPTYRYRDLEREIDLIEEVARLYGYDKFQDTLPDAAVAGFLSLDAELLRNIRGHLRAQGFNELMHYSYALQKSPDGKLVDIANPMFSEYSSLRSELISHLLQSYQFNQEQGNGALWGFEIGKVFAKDEGGLFENEVLAGICGGDARAQRWTTSDKPINLSWYEAKGLLDNIWQRLGMAVEYQADQLDPKLHPGRTASLWLQGERLGIFGQVHPQLQQQMDFTQPVYVFQIDLDVMLNYLAADERLVPKYGAFSTYPASDRDLAFFAPLTVSFADLEKAVRQVAGELLAEVQLFDEYRGQGVPDGQRSLALRMIYRADRTLKDSDIEPAHQKVRDILVEKFQVALRS
jgi:phenylalanyl-tRNA synthetase beta chain